MLKLSNLESIGKPVYKFQNNHSVDFDGVDDFIQLGEPISYTQHTISTWIKITNETSARVIFDARDSNQDGILLFVTDTELITHRIGDGTSVDLTTSTPLTSNEWHHIVATYDGATRKLYTNGTLAASDTISKTIETTTKARIGIASYTDVAPFKGKIDELAIYDRALEEEEVTKIYRIKYGANLVQNGRFDELGSELAINGSFDTTIPLGNDGSGWQSSDGNASYFEGGVKLARVTGLCRLLLKTTGGSSNTLTQSKTYKINYQVVSNTGTNNLQLYLSGTTHSVTSSVGTHTAYLLSGSTGQLFQIRNSVNSTEIVIDNVSVKQVDPNDRFTLGTGVEYGNGFVKMNNSEALQGAEQLNVITSGVKCKVTFTVQNYVSGTVNLRHPLSQEVTANGTYVFIGEANSTKLLIRGNALTNNFEVTNLMVEQQKYVATNLKLNSIPYSSSNLRNYYRMGDGILDTHPLICDMVQPSLGSELNDLTWSANGGWSITDGIASNDGSGSTLINDILEVGKTYKIKLQLSAYTSGNFSVFLGSTTESSQFNGTDEFTFYGVCSGDTFARIKSFSGIGSVIIENISIKQVNGLAGIMKNMTESDITNDVPS